jgi:NADPH:quinone reductase-like Zn-dependent oxidoreductase
LLFDRLKSPYGPQFTNDAILIINGAGGVGSMLIQMARRLTGLTVIATASRPETIAWRREMGAHHVIDHHEPLEEGLKAIWRPRSAVRRRARRDRPAPKIDHRGAGAQGAQAIIDDPETFDIVPFKLKSLSVHWELMFTRPLFAAADMAAQHPTRWARWSTWASTHDVPRGLRSHQRRQSQACARGARERSLDRQDRAVWILSAGLGLARRAR